MAMERMLPEFVKSCRETSDPLFIHQDAFGADYDKHELQPRIRVRPRRFPLFLRLMLLPACGVGVLTVAGTDDIDSRRARRIPA